AKNAQAFPESLDHFKCYRAAGRVKQLDLKLSDQFTDVAATLLRPIEFCNPVDKTHGDVVTPIKHRKAHLLCYTITPTPFTVDARVRNQFVPNGATLTLGAADILCAP